MSRSNPTTGNTSPIKKYLQFSGGTGTINYYDKEKEEKIELDSVTFVVLDVKNSITGYEEVTSSSFGSNLVGNTGKEVMNVVKWKKGKSTDFVSGLYKDIKDRLKGTGAKFTANVIALAEINGEEQIVNLQFAGAALNDWITFTNEHSNNAYYDYRITVSTGVLSKREEGKTVPVTPKEEADLDAKLKKNPRAPKPVWFYSAKFEYVDLTPEEAERATEEDVKVQAYFKGLSSTTTETKETPANVTGADAPDAEEEDDDLPF